MAKIALKLSITFFLAQLILILSALPSSAGVESQLTSLGTDQFQPAISGDKVAWLDGINNPDFEQNSNIYLLSLGGAAQKVTAVNKAHAPAISADRVVWEDLRNDVGAGVVPNSDIFGYTLPGGPEGAINTDAAPQLAPDVSGSQVVWQAFKNGRWDIFLKKTDGSVVQVTNDVAIQRHPRIDGDNIVWQDGRNGQEDVYLYNITAGHEARITDSGGNHTEPDISGNRIVWTDSRSGIRNIFAYDLSNPVPNGAAVDARAFTQHGARISGNRVVWTDWRNGDISLGDPYGNSDIYTHNFATGQNQRLTSDPWNQNSPDISGQRVVWTDWRSGNWDVYMYDFGPPVAPTGAIAVNNGAAYTNSTSATLSLTTNAAGPAEMSFSANNVTWSAWEPFASSKSYSLAPGDGAKTIYVKFKDIENVASTATISDSIILDTGLPVDPSITTSTPAPGAWSNDNTININWSGGSDPGSGVDGYSVSWSQNTTEAPDLTLDLQEAAVATTSPALADGTWWFNLRTKDNAGNWTSTRHAGPFMIETAPPTNSTAATETGGAPDGVWQNSFTDPNFTWLPGADSSSGVKGYYYYWGTNPGGAPTTWTASPSYNPPAVGGTGAYYLRVKTEDNAGNQSAPATLFTFKYDGDAPVNPAAPAAETHGVLSDYWQNNCFDPAFTWPAGTDPASGVKGYYYYWGVSSTGTPTVWTTGTAFDPPAVPSVPATYYLRVKTEDNVGNQSAAATLFVFKYDDRVPSNPTSTIEAGGATSANWQNTVNDPAFTWSGAQSGSGGAPVNGYYYYWGTDPAGTSTDYTTQTAYDPPTVADPSVNYLRVKTVDDASNTADWTTLFAFEYDAQAPVDPAISATSPAPGVWTNGNRVSVNWFGATDGAGSGIDGFSTSWSQNLAGTPDATVDFQETDTSTTGPVLTDGIWWFNLRTQDNAGNWTSTRHAGPFKIDTVAPSTSMSSPAISTNVSKTRIFRVAWAGADSGSGAASYDVQYKIGLGGPWTGWKSGTTVSSADFTIGNPGNTYYFRARARDVAGNTGLFSAESKTILPFDQNSKISKRVGFAGTLSKASSGNFLGTLWYSVNAGDELVYKAKGNYFALITNVGKGRGKAAIYVDGKLKKTIDTGAKSTKYRQVVYSISFAAAGKHSVRIVNKGTAGRPTINVDALAVGN